MLTAPKERHESIANALADLRRVPMQFEPQGSMIVFSERNEQ
jgi:D-glycero-alpha-D-manno-heptose-7-phosphate kinase